LEGKRQAECEKRLKESGVDDWWKNQTQFVNNSVILSRIASEPDG